MTVTERLTIWTAISVLAWLCTLWMLYQAARRYRRVRRTPQPPGVRWVHLYRLVCSVLMIVVWTGVVTVGALGFLPSWSEYRSWAMLATVIVLAAQQFWNTYSWERIGS